MKARINAIFSAILLLVAVPTIQAMNPAKRAFKSTKKQISALADAVQRAITGETPTNVVITQLNTPPTNPLSDPNGSDFNLLPKDVRNQIIFSLSQFGISNSLFMTGQAINSLAQVNKELNQLINDPEVYFKMSRNLANRFGVSNEEVANALQTEQAKKELSSQKNLFNLCLSGGKLTPTANASLLLQLINQGADLNFVYENGDTPLMIAIYTNQPLAIALIEAGADLNIVNKENKTPLMAAKEVGNNELIKDIEKKLQSK